MILTTFSWINVSANVTSPSHLQLLGTRLGLLDRFPSCLSVSWQSLSPFPSFSHGRERSASEEKVILAFSSATSPERERRSAGRRVSKRVCFQMLHSDDRSRVAGAPFDHRAEAVEEADPIIEAVVVAIVKAIHRNVFPSSPDLNLLGRREEIAMIQHKRLARRGKAASLTSLWPMFNPQQVNPIVATTANSWFKTTFCYLSELSYVGVALKTLHYVTF
jgi:hypothetical protein